MPKVKCILLTICLVPFATVAQSQQRGLAGPSGAMNRLIRAFEGSYITVERHQPDEEFPNGGIRRGTAVIRSTAGGNAMITEVHSHAPQGYLDYTGVFWWDSAAGLYRLLMCAKQFPEGCLTGATARWDGDEFVRTQEVKESGKKVLLRDTISFAPDSFTNVAEMSIDGGPMKELVRTTATRRPN